MSRTESDMTVGRPLPVILKFAWPLILGNMFQQLYNMVDTIIVGRFVGADALAAVGSTGTIMFLVLGFCNGFATGFTVLTSQMYGAGERHRVQHSVSNGIILALIFSAVMTALSLGFMKPILHMMNTPANIFDDAYTYISIICMGIVTSFFYNLLSSLLRAVGNSKTPLLFLMVSAGLNVVLDLLFTVGMRMGVAGAALATVLAQGISAAACLVYIYKKVPVLQPQRSDWRLTRADTRHQIHMGLPMALQYAISASGTMIMQAAVNLFGSTAVAAFTAASKAQGLFTQVFLSMGQAMAAFCGQNFGKGDLNHLKKGVRDATLATIVMGLVAGALILLTMHPMLSLFFTGGTDFEEIISWARPYLIMCAACYIPLGFIFVFRSSMQGCGYALLPTLSGVVELVTRLVLGIAGMKTMNYLMASGCDPAAWLTAGIYTLLAWSFIARSFSKGKKGEVKHA